MLNFRGWRNGAKEREKSTAAHRSRTFIPSVIDLTAHAFNLPPSLFVNDDSDGDPTFEAPTFEVLEPIPPPRRRGRRRRRNTPPT